MSKEVPGRSAQELRALLAQASGALKVFPLHGVAVLPGTPTPFHIFEPRYRELTRAALFGDRLLAVANLEQPGTELDPRPSLRAIAGACVIEEDELLDDGRYDLLTRGLARVRLLEELETGRPYREFRVQVLDDVLPAGGAVALRGEVTALEQCVLELASLLPPESGAAQLAEAAAGLAHHPGALADLVAAAVVSEAAARVRVLEELRVERRLELVTQEVASVILMLSRGRSPSA
ncbi:LON peptidase substrate-binding domain-containing protein [Anaeromyxobacter paludicola]|uniref:Lon N-terminal domain-containing protein n=1 Tax=Anaeromyxobacter paludicola TaxID=2918171 RepID=A0ABN6N8U8_9BACT|nr:LON peptidase substrate-binding domain-containing protein [Anaeromyxobacter paludicola]BDG09665.1 hypothetical protein AMPC_27780 [Anaeromyxobacter paludicola]